MEFAIEVLKAVINLAGLWAAWWAGKEGWFQYQNRWNCPHKDCYFRARATQAWVIDHIRDDHLMAFHS